MKILIADHVLPISSGPIAPGAVAIEDGRITDVGPAHRLIETYPDAEVENFGEAAILPGLVNCHSHIEITAMRGALDSIEHDFSAWLLRLNSMRASLSEDEIRVSALAGAIEGARAGVTCFGDIGRFGSAGLEALKAIGLRGILFQETEFSVENRTAKRDFEALIEKFTVLRARETKLVKVGISPHSPYTVSPHLFQLIVDFAHRTNIQLTVHAAESEDESELLLNGAGLFTDIYKKFGVEWQSPHCSSVEYLNRLDVLSERLLLAHCVTISASDIRLLGKNDVRVAHCPKSNAKFGHGSAPFEAMLAAGIHVGLGSDSVASNNSCDLLEDARFAILAARNRMRTKRFISAREALETATIGGANALRLGDQIGTLEPGKQADLAVVSLGNVGQQPVHDIYTALVFASSGRDVVMTMVAGEEVYRHGAPATFRRPTDKMESETIEALKAIQAKLR